MNRVTRNGNRALIVAAATAIVIGAMTSAVALAATAGPATAGVIRAGTARPAAAGPLGSAGAGASHRARARTRIVARPDRARAGTKIVLVGRHFKRHARLTITECTRPAWVVPANACNRKNVVKVRTNGHGAFRTRIKVLVCPAGRSPVPAVRSRHCYIGVPTANGIDVVRLLGAVRITVTRS